MTRRFRQCSCGPAGRPASSRGGCGWPGRGEGRRPRRASSRPPGGRPQGITIHATPPSSRRRQCAVLASSVSRPGRQDVHKRLSSLEAVAACCLAPAARGQLGSPGRVRCRRFRGSAGGGRAQGLRREGSAAAAAGEGPLAASARRRRRRESSRWRSPGRSSVVGGRPGGDAGGTNGSVNGS